MTEFKTLSGNFSWRADKVTWPITSDVGPGLAGVVATTTEVSWLDPTSGTLMYRGVPIERLAGEQPFETVAHLLITGMMPENDPEDYERFRARLRTSRRLPDDVIALVRDMDPETHPTRLLRAGVSALGCHELSAGDDLSGEIHWRELRIVGQVAALVGDIARFRRGEESVPFSEEGSLAECTLVALTGRRPLPEEIDTLDLLWVLYADHGLDAPTFTSMIVASALADPYYNVVAGLSALRGPKLGGAGERVLEQILPLRDPDEVATWVQDTIARGGKIAGFGHRLYRMPDPRVVILRKQTAALARLHGREDLFAIARTVEDEASRWLTPKGVHININFYAALLFHLLGADGPLVPCLYAVGRMAGLVARVHEALENNRLYRPLSQYLGVPDRRFIPLEER